MEENKKGKPDLCTLSNELLCHVLSFLPLKEVLRMSMMNRKLNTAVKMHLMLCKEIDFCQEGISTYMPIGIKDKNIIALLSKCPNLETIRGLRPHKVDRWRLRKLSSLSIPGIVEALFLCPALKRIETNNLKLLESVSQYFPQVEIIGVFRNRDGVFPPQSNQQLKLSPLLRITSLHLIGVQVPELTVMPELQYLYLQWVSFTRLHPFRAFSAAKLKTFVMRHCAGPALPLRYYSLFIALGLATELSRIELVRVPLLGGMINRTVEDVLRERGFHRLRKIVIGDCKGIIESDVGQLIIAASPSLESLTIQASLTKDSLFVSLHFARCDFSRLKTLHLGFIDEFPPKEEWSNDSLLRAGLIDAPDVPSSITDTGMKFVSQLFPNVRNLTISNCPHVTDPMRWIPEGRGMWEDLEILTLEKCHCLRLAKFSRFLRVLKFVEVVVLKNMFREPPKGCSHVGLSAGTGLGLASAVVSTQDEHIAVQGHQIEAVQENDNRENNGNASDDDDDDNDNGNLIIGADNGNIGVPRNQPAASQRRRRRRQQRNPAHANELSNNDNHEEEVQERTTRSSSKQAASGLVSKGPKLRSSRNSARSDRNNVSELSEPSCSKSQQLSTAVQSNCACGNTGSNKKRKISSRSSASPRAKSSHYLRRCKDSNSQDSSSSETESDLENSARPSTSKGKTLQNPSNSLCSCEKDGYNGPITRRRKKIMTAKVRLSRPRTSCTQSTQTIRSNAPQSLSYRASSTSPSSVGTTGAAAAVPSTSKCGMSTRARQLSSSKDQEKAKKPKKCDKATSTSDPLLEDDVTEVFTVVSNSLRSLTVISCGISHIVLKDCEYLSHLEAQSCRILKSISIPSAPELQRFNISLCPKLEVLKVITETLQTKFHRPVVVYIQPYDKNYSLTTADIEHCILTEAPPSYCLAVLQDFCSDDRDRGSIVESIMQLLIFMDVLTHDMAIAENFNRQDKDKEYPYKRDIEDDEPYPWGHYIERFFGTSKTSSYELLANSSLLPALWKDYLNFETGTVKLDDEHVFRCPDYCGNLAESIESERVDFKQYIGFYIHLSDNQDSG